MVMMEKYNELQYTWIPQNEIRGVKEVIRQSLHLCFMHLKDNYSGMNW